MAILNFTLSPEALGKLHDALVCLGKFSEDVSIEAAHDKVRGTSLALQLLILIQIIVGFDCSQLFKVSICILQPDRAKIFHEISI